MEKHHKSSCSMHYRISQISLTKSFSLADIEARFNTWSEFINDNFEKLCIYMNQCYNSLFFILPTGIQFFNPCINYDFNSRKEAPCNLLLRVHYIGSVLFLNRKMKPIKPWKLLHADLFLLP